MKAGLGVTVILVLVAIFSVIAITPTQSTADYDQPHCLFYNQYISTRNIRETMVVASASQPTLTQAIDKSRDDARAALIEVLKRGDSFQCRDEDGVYILDETILQKVGLSQGEAGPLSTQKK